MNTYTHLGFDDARDEMIRLEVLLKFSSSLFRKLVIYLLARK